MGDVNERSITAVKVNSRAPPPGPVSAIRVGHYYYDYYDYYDYYYYCRAKFHAINNGYVEKALLLLLYYYASMVVLLLFLLLLLRRSATTAIPPLHCYYYSLT